VDDTLDRGPGRSPQHIFGPFNDDLQIVTGCTMDNVIYSGKGSGEFVWFENIALYESYRQPGNARRARPPGNACKNTAIPGKIQGFHKSSANKPARAGDQDGLWRIAGHFPNRGSHGESKP
jgi:hypothetical protein